VTVRLGEAPINGLTTTVAAREIHGEERLGINVEALDAELRQATGLEGEGVVLTEVARGSAADRRGVAGYRGDRLVQVNEDPIGTTDDVRSALNDVQAGEIVSLHFENRAGQIRVVNVRMPQ